jgi:hypothetical protein
VVDTRLASVLVASEDCSNDSCFPIYDSDESETGNFSRDLVYKPWQNTGQDLSYSAKLMTDTICLFENNACAQKVGFLAMGEDWVYHNILGLSPKTLTAGPVILQKLSVEILNEQRATIQINPMESRAKSTLTLGSKDGISDKVVGKWYSHPLKESQNGAFVLEVETIALAKDRKVNKELTVRNIDVLLGSKLNDLLFISGDQ